MQLLLLHYNNYFNRIIKKENTIADYKAADADYKEASNINFNPGDGVNASLILGLGQNGSLFEGDDFDYLVAYEVVNEVNVIDSRWFIVEQDRKRSGQYELTLKRDVLADNYNKVIILVKTKLKALFLAIQKLLYLGRITLALAFQKILTL